MDVTVHSELSREIFDFNNKLKPKIKDVLLEIAKKVLEELEEDIEISDIVLTGSMANYTYNEASDLDLHIVFDFGQINKDKKLVKKALDCNKYVWNMRHDIFLKNHEVELYYQDINEPHAATGMY
jgi:predicted nucleotidyltransferase